MHGGGTFASPSYLRVSRQRSLHHHSIPLKRMKLVVDDRYGAAVIQIQGKFLGSVHGGELAEKLDELKVAGKKNVIFDLSKLDFVDSSGLGAMITGLTTMRNVGGDVRLAGTEARVKNVFVVTNVLGNVFQDYATVDEAEASFRTDPRDRIQA